jgi:hypothetical protein
MTPAQWFCLIGGLALLAAGILGMISDSTFDTGMHDLQGDSLLGFEVNGWHNVVHILSGLLLLSAFRRRGPAKTVAIVFGLLYGIVTIIGLIDGEDVLGIFPVNPADNILHIALTVISLVAGLVSKGHYDDDTAATGDRARFGRTQDAGQTDSRTVGGRSDRVTGQR